MSRRLGVRMFRCTDVWESRRSDVRHPPGRSQGRLCKYVLCFEFAFKALVINLSQALLSSNKFITSAVKRNKLTTSSNKFITLAYIASPRDCLEVV